MVKRNMKYFGTDGIRGVFGKDLSIELVERVANAVALQNPQKVVIGQDTRNSCEPIVRTMIDVLHWSGTQIVNIGVVPTTALAFLTKELKADMGIMVTASHNPASDNGIKLFNKRGEKLDGAELEHIDMLIDPRNIWQDFLYDKFTKIFAGKKLPRIAIDFANGSGTGVAINVLQRLGFDVVAFNDKPDGNNINLNCGAVHPDIASLANAKADICFAFDGDADRCTTIGSDGKVIPGDIIMTALATHIGIDTLISTIMFNGGAEQYLKSKNIKLIRTNVGDRYLLAELKKNTSKKAFGAEPSGHMIFPELIMAGDGLVVALKVLQMLVETNKTIAELTSEIPIWASILVNVTEDLPAGETMCDGCRVLIRKSGTEKVTRIYIEGETKQKCEIVLEQILNLNHI